MTIKLHTDMMKTIITIALILITSIGWAVLPIISEFSARSENQNAVCEWSSGNETGVVAYRVERSFNGTQFDEIGSVEPMGNSHQYRFIDHDLFKGETHTFYYRICIELSNGRNQYTDSSPVIINTSGITRTWGSIKAMFR